MGGGGGEEKEENKRKKKNDKESVNIFKYMWEIKVKKEWKEYNGVIWQRKRWVDRSTEWTVLNIKN